MGNDCHNLLDSIEEDKMREEMEQDELRKKNPEQFSYYEEEYPDYIPDEEEGVGLSGNPLELEHKKQKFYLILSALFSKDNTKINQYKINISSLNMQEINYTDLDFSNAIMTNTNLDRCVFENVKFPKEQFSVFQEETKFVNCLNTNSFVNKNH